MGSKWIKSQYPGVRFREHKVRTHNGQPDRYFTIYYKLHGKLHEEALGWASEGWNAKKASIELNRLKHAQATGEGPATLAERRQVEHDRKEKEKEKKEQETAARVTFSEFFTKTYYPHAQTDKTQRSYEREDQLYRLWISPALSELPLIMIHSAHLEEVKKAMQDGGCSTRSIRYALAVIRQVFNYAKFCRVFQGDNPISNVKMPQEDNRRFRFLTQEEADRLLGALKAKSQQLYEVALVSLQSGARAEEIMGLKWSDLDFKNMTMTLWDTKNTNTRMARMTNEIKEVLLKKRGNSSSALVFPGKNDIQSKQISATFGRTVEELGFNKNNPDRRMKVVFHTLRHTYASWLVQNGESLYTVKELMGHSTLAMTERYAHLSTDNLKQAVDRLENSISKKRANEES